MGKLLVVLIDLDEAYITALERKFVEVLGEYADISIITDMCYFNEYFSIPRDIDILVINEQLYDQQLSSHNIDATYVLTENPTENNPENSFNYIYKYTSVQEIFLQISSNEVVKEIISNNGENNTKLVFMYSPMGGVGTTTLSLGVASMLKKVGYSVLYVSMENMQSFINCLDNKTTLDNDVKDQIKKASAATYASIKSNIIKGEFDYLPPFADTLDMLDIQPNDYVEFFKSIKNANEYDYVVVDTDSYLSKDIIKIMSEAYKNIIITNQSKNACYKLEKMGRAIEGIKGDKFIIICNMYNEDVTNNLINCQGIFFVADYLYYEEELRDASLEKLGSSGEIARVVRYIINN